MEFFSQKRFGEGNHEAQHRNKESHHNIAHFKFSNVIQNEIGFKHCITLISYQLSALSTGK
jgi:hypothetical protein